MQADNNNYNYEKKQMPNYLLAHHGGEMPESPEEGAEHMAKVAIQFSRESSLVLYWELLCTLFWVLLWPLKLI